MFDATTRSGGTATVSPRSAAAELAVATAGGPVPPAGFAARVTRVLLSPWSRLSLLVLLLASAATAVLLFQPQQLLTDGWPPQLGGVAAAVAYAVAYGVCTVAFVPRPLLNLAAGALFGSSWASPRRWRGRCSARGSPSAWAGCWARTRCVRCCGASG